MQAIETVYAGYRFRSRLEARWAVFFDYAGLRWHYEVEGYTLSDGTRYLPDFNVIGHPNKWVEVKGNLTAKDLPRIETAAKDLQGQYAVAGDVFRQPRRGVCLPWLAVAQGWTGWVPGSDVESLIPVVPYSDMTPERLTSGYCVDLEIPWYKEAARKAQQARFEFGETPGRGF